MTANATLSGRGAINASHRSAEAESYASCLAQAVELSDKCLLELMSCGKRSLIPADELIEGHLEVVAVDDALLTVDDRSIRASRPDAPSILGASLVQKPASDADVKVPRVGLVTEVHGKRMALTEEADEDIAAGRIFVRPQRLAVSEEAVADFLDGGFSMRVHWIAKIEKPSP